MRRQARIHKLTYPVLNGERGTLRDPTRKRFRWAPHAIVVDAQGRLVQTYGHMPNLTLLREDLESLVKTGWIARRPDEGWRRFGWGAWVKMRVADGFETRRFKAVGRDSVTVEVLRTPDAGEPSRSTETLFRAHVKPAGGKLIEHVPATVTIDGRGYACRVIQRGDEKLWIATDPFLPQMLLRRERPGASMRVVSFDKPFKIGGKTVSCWIVERNGKRTWYSLSVPGFVVKKPGATVVAFGRR